MLDNIRMHLHKDESEQIAIESKAAEQLALTFKRNKQAFSRYVPALSGEIKALSWLNMGIFCNKRGQFNIVDKSVGRTFYGPAPRSEILQQYENRIINAPRLCLSSPDEKGQSGLQERIECLLILGVGIGFHLKELIEQHNISHCVIYEPEKQYFFASLLCFDWHNFLKRCHEKKVKIYFQLGQDASNIVSDLNELIEHFSVGSASIYKHYNIPTFNAIEREVRLRTWSDLKQKGVSWGNYTSQPFNLPQWTLPTELTKWRQTNTPSNERYLENIEAFELYFPDIAAQFKDYKPQRWQAVEDESGAINIESIQFPEYFHGNDPREECDLNYKVFSDFPNRDGLVLGYDGTKLKEYTHYKFVSATETLIENLEDKQGTLPESIKAIILFGLASGYQLDALVQKHSIENLFICEPEPDFFYASLFAIDWARILKNIDDNDARIYINIGDNGANLFRDLIRQFYAIGPYVLVNTFFYQSYFRPDLVEAVNQLREQLQVVIALGECYDHARYGIAHTVEIIDRGIPFLKKNPDQYLSYDTKETPVFIVGNGPSLDHSIKLIKEHSGNAIIVSCGTTLQVLYKNGIKPDFHAEIEQNRSTFDWISRVGAPDYVRDITLISCNGIHPDTCNLFGEVLLAFKEGESSTVSALKLLSEDQLSTLEFAFPTVTNFVINLFLELHFSQLYLLGVDLGFVDETTHHSKQSGYYSSDGNELYDYAEKNSIAISVPGNFKPHVSTKYEFKVAKEIIEQSLFGKRVECFNCSDGARIAGTIPLALENMLLVSSESQKQTAIEDLKSRAFSSLSVQGEYKKKFNAHYDAQQFSQELSALCTQVEDALKQEICVEQLITKQKDMLYDSYQSGNSLLFYLLYGTSNYANAVFSKLQLVSSKSIDGQSESDTESIQQALESWRHTLKAVAAEYCPFPDAFDFAYSMHLQRERALLTNTNEPRSTYFLCDRQFDGMFIRWFNFFSAENHTCIDSWETRTSLKQGDTLLVLLRETDRSDVESKLEQILQTCENAHVIVADENESTVKRFRSQFSGIDFSFVLSIDPIRTPAEVELFLNSERPLNTDELAVSFLAKASLFKKPFDLMVPKLSFTAERKDVQLDYVNKLNSHLSKFKYICDFPDYILAADSSARLIEMDWLGNRGRPMLNKQEFTSFLNDTIKSNVVERLLIQFEDGRMGGKNFGR